VSAPEIAIDRDWIISWTGTEDCHGGCGQYGDTHEPSCGIEPLMSVSEAVRLLRGMRCCGTGPDPMCLKDGGIDGLIAGLEEGDDSAAREALDLLFLGDIPTSRPASAPRCAASSARTSAAPGSS
jgi:hypothetical protein